MRPESLGANVIGKFLPPDPTLVAAINGAVEAVGQPETGVAIFVCADRTIAVVPPFPIREDVTNEGADTSPLLELLAAKLTVGVVLLRLGRYAVGVIQGESLVASKSGSRYVKNRHRAGGSSQRRFMRSRDRLIQELFDKACEVSQNVFSPYDKTLDYILMGGERHTLRAFTERCDYLRRMGSKRLSRILNVDRPGKNALDGIAYEVWKSRVLVFEAESEG